MLNLAGLKGRVELSAEVVAAFEWFTSQENSSLAEGDIAMVLDCGHGTVDYGCFKKAAGMYQGIVRSDAISMGPSNLIQIAEDYIRNKCGEDLRGAFELLALDYRHRFRERMHSFDPTKDASDLDHCVEFVSTASP